MKIRLKGSDGFNSNEMAKHFGGLPGEGETVEVEATGAFRNTEGYTIIVFKDPRAKNPKNAGLLRLEVSRFQLMDAQRAWLARELRHTSSHHDTENEVDLRKTLRRVEREMESTTDFARPNATPTTAPRVHTGIIQRPTAPGANA